jgi:hypothetical protein
VIVMTPSPSNKDLDAYRERLAAAYATLDEAKTGVEAGLDAVEGARDEARKLHDTATATNIFNNILADIHLAARALTDAIAGLPPLDETGVEEGDRD